jgi:hypothetical protein
MRDEGEKTTTNFVEGVRAGSSKVRGPLLGWFGRKRRGRPELEKRVRKWPRARREEEVGPPGRGKNWA